MVWLVSWRQRQAHTMQKYFMLHKVFYCEKLSNKQSAKVICRFDRAAHSKSNENLPVAHAFDYIVFTMNPGLTSCKDQATVVDNSLGNNSECIFCASTSK